MAAFDWYQATVPVGVDDLLESFCGLSEAASIQHGKGAHGYAHSTAVVGPDGPVARVLHGGTHEYPHAVITGENAQAGAECIRAAFPEHFVTRADAREDFGDPGAFDRITPVMLGAAVANRVKVGCAGDWALTMKARTLYLGSPSSACRQRLYDKAAELRAKFAADPVRLAQVPDELVRLEAQVRPQTREARLAFATIEPMAVMGSSRWLREVWRGVSGLDLQPVQVGKLWRQSDDDRAWAYMLAQYGGMLRRRCVDLGDWACVGKQIGSDLVERDRARRS
jgi:hypothetical protein